MSKKTRLVEVTATITKPYHALFEVPNSICNEDVYLYVRGLSEDHMHPFDFFHQYAYGDEWHVEGVSTVEDGKGFPPSSTTLPQRISVEDIKEFQDE